MKDSNVAADAAIAELFEKFSQVAIERECVYTLEFLQITMECFQRESDEYFARTKILQKNARENVTIQ